MFGKIGRALLVFIPLLIVVLVVLRLLHPLPDASKRETSTAMPASDRTALGAAILPLAAEHPAASGIYALGNGVDAFAARVVLARAAEESIDAQYYIWADDLTGIRLLAELQEAAKRGVRVRLLVDDNGTHALDQELVALAALPTAEVRFFNPFMMRKPRVLNYAFDFFRLNRRMHNKSFTVDGAVTIVGGRNIGDVYFETGAGHLFFDLDVLAAGPAAAEVATDFDGYWNSALAFPASTIISALPDAAGRLAARDEAMTTSPQGLAYSQAVRDSTLVRKLEAGDLPFEWVSAKLFSDDPAKALGRVHDDDLMIEKLLQAIGTPEHSIDLVSAYFIPGVGGAASLADFARTGATVRTLTNALEATDVVPVHAGYARYRDTLLEGGVEVYELRAEGGDRKSINDLGIAELSKASLHAKSLSIDRKRAFIGSFNFDPRSKQLNCEMGLLIESPTIAGAMSDWLDANLPRLAWKVTRSEEGGLLWTSRDADGAEVTSTVEPNTTAPLRGIVTVVGWLPVEWLL